ncbi:DUF397 domain-containing protein [Actinomadura logoneensis]|uniref:DUF397 domain-containing protein n=1 Tax=Actinomadura logoneensis TaxID=2293572 RepID=A0A372JUE3_9ACTN|nr:DUF397 domain-containing protein [Actinomadura logoneensis]RFU43590.1 DUF397 domain-containing protein [Actinomadura logoneensis]
MIVWRKSSHSEGQDQGGTCVELADLGTSVGVRDSKNPSGSHLTLTRTDLHQLTEAIRNSRR